MDPIQDPTEEAALRSAVLRGDEAAWRTFYRRGFAPLWAFVRARAGPGRDAAEEVVQECWMIAVKRIGAFDPHRGPFEAWLKGIAHNVLRNRARRGSEQPAPLAGDEPAAPLPVADNRERIALAMTSLPWVWQEVLQAKYRDGLGVAEIAARSGRSEKAVESLLSRARDAFRRAFKGLEGDDP